MKKGWKRSLALCLVAVMVAALMPAPAAETAYAADGDGCRQWWYDRCAEDGITVVQPSGPVAVPEGRENHIMVDMTGIGDGNATLEFTPSEAGTYVIAAKAVIISYSNGTYKETPYSEIGSSSVLGLVQPRIWPFDEDGDRDNDPYVGELIDDQLAADWGLWVSTPFDCEAGPNQFYFAGGIPSGYDNVFYDVWAVKVDRADIMMTNLEMQPHAASDFIKLMMTGSGTDVFFTAPLSYEGTSYYYNAPSAADLIRSFRWSGRYTLDTSSYGGKMDLSRTDTPFAALSVDSDTFTVDAADPTTAYLTMDFGFTFKLQLLDPNSAPVDLTGTDPMEKDVDYTVVCSYDQTLADSVRENGFPVPVRVVRPKLTIDAELALDQRETTLTMTTGADGVKELTVPHRYNADNLLKGTIEIDTAVVSDSPVDVDENGEPKTFTQAIDPWDWLRLHDLTVLEDGCIQLYDLDRLNIRLYDNATNEEIRNCFAFDNPKILKDNGSYTMKLFWNDVEIDCLRIYVESYYDPAVTGFKFEQNEYTVETGSGDLDIPFAITPLDAEHTYIYFEDTNEPDRQERYNGAEGFYRFNPPDEPGDFTVTGRTGDGDYTDTVIIHVIEPVVILPTSITLDKTEIDLDPFDGETTLTAKILPADATDTEVYWEIGDESIVQGGQIDYETNTLPLTAQEQGTTTVTARTGNGLTATCTVRVYYPEEPPLAAPVIKVTNVSAGVKVTWDPVEGAESYTVFWNCPDVDFWSNESVKGTSYTIPRDQLFSGLETIYSVDAEASGNRRTESNVVSKTYMDAPTITKTRNVNAGIEVTWDAVDGAKSYAVMYKTGSGGWKTAKSGLTATKYVVPKAELKSGTKYQFTIKSVAEDGETSGYYSGNAQTYMTTPAVTKTRNVNAGIEVTWGSVTGATSYVLMYKVDGGSWETYKSGITATKFVVPKKDLESGTKYWFTVKAKGAATSGYSSGKAQTYMTTPVVKSAVKTSSGVKVTWGAVTGAKTYTVMMKVSGGSWTTVKTGVTGTSYTVPKSKLTSGKTYYFTVKAKGAATSGYSSGKSLTYKA